MLIGHHAKTPESCKWVIENFDGPTDNGTVKQWVADCKEFLESLSDGGEIGSTSVIKVRRDQEQS